MGRLKKNTIVSLMAQAITIICGFILPRVMLKSYGSEVNGLVNSINQFLHMIAFLELGIGAVIQSALYKPLCDNDTVKISQIMTSANRFYRKIATVLVVYIIALVIIYPQTAGKSFDFISVAILIVALAAYSFFQYYFGIVNALLLTADQRGYIVQALTILVVVGNTLISVILINLGCSIQVVKVASAVVFLIKPFILWLYIKKYYSVNYKEKYDVEPIAQKWYGIAQHIAAIVLDGTDVIVLTLFSSLADVSVYSIYNLVVTGVRNLVMSIDTGMTALIGELVAKQERKKLYEVFARLDWLIHTVTTIVFGCTLVLIIPFISVYTRDIKDTNYINYSFAIIITVAQEFRCLRLPYNTVILAGGHYKQTQSNYIVAASLNILVSIMMVMRFGLVGVAIGTLVAFLYQNVWMAYYISRNIICWPFVNFIKQMIVDISVALVGYFATKSLLLGRYTYITWFLNGILVFVIWVLISLLFNCVFYRNHVKESIKQYLKIGKNRE